MAQGVAGAGAVPEGVDARAASCSARRSARSRRGRTATRRTTRRSRSAGSRTCRVFGQFTYVTVGLSNTEWSEDGRPRVELVLGSTVDLEACSQILANLAFHLQRVSVLSRSPARWCAMSLQPWGRVTCLSGYRTSTCSSPRAWNLDLPLDEGPPPITIAQVFPISESEYQTWRGLGACAFEMMMADRRIDIRISGAAGFDRLGRSGAVDRARRYRPLLSDGRRADRRARRRELLDRQGRDGRDRRHVSGSGKSTLLNILGCLDTPSRGQLPARGHDVQGLSRRRARARAQSPDRLRVPELPAADARDAR